MAPFCFAVIFLIIDRVVFCCPKQSMDMLFNNDAGLVSDE